MSGVVRIALRPFEAADLQVVAAWLEAEGFGVPGASSHKVWGDRLRADPLIVCRVATVGAERMGFFRLDVGPDRAAEISILVAAGERRRGIGRQLLDAGLAEARGRGLRAVVAAVRGDNGPALALFRGAGFEESGQHGPGFVHLHKVGLAPRHPPLEASP